MARAAILHFARSTASRHLSSENQNFHPICHQWRYGMWLHKAAVETSPKSINWFSIAQKRLLSQSSTPEDDSKISIGPQRGETSGDSNKDTWIVYYGPISSTIKNVKLLSLSTCCLSVSLGPVITFMTSSGMNVILKGAVASTVILLSASTTAALHWFVSPYIHKLRWKPGSDSFDVEMLSWRARYVPKTITFSDIRLPETNRPFATFKANGKFYFVDEEHCHNKAFLAKLTPQKATQDFPLKNS